MFISQSIRNARKVTIDHYGSPSFSSNTLTASAISMMPVYNDYNSTFYILAADIGKVYAITNGTTATDVGATGFPTYSYNTQQYLTTPYKAADGKWVIVGSGTKNQTRTFYTTTDFVTFTARQSGVQSGCTVNGLGGCVKYSNSAYYVLASANLANPTVLTSTTGYDGWTAVTGQSGLTTTPGTNGGYDLGALGSNLYAICANSTATYIYSSSNAKTWSLVYTDTSTNKVSRNLKTINGRLFALGSKDSLLHTTDGTNWTRATLPTSTSVWCDIAFDGYKWIVPETATTNRVAYSTDLINWSLSTAPISPGYYDVGGIAIGPDRVIMGNNSKGWVTYSI